MSENPISKLSADDFRAFLSDNESRKAFMEAVISVFDKDLLGKRFNSYNIDSIGFLTAAVTSSEYAARHMVNAHRANSDLDLLKFSVDSITINGLILEFGVSEGRTVNYIADLLPGKKIYGFDSFQGLPEKWRPGFDKGAFSRSEPPSIRDNVELIVGWFDRTLPIFRDSHPDQKAALIHIDCDIYLSAQIALYNMKNYIVPGSIIVFDEYFNYPGWRRHEFRSFKEFVKANRIHYEYIGLVPHHQQVAVRILG